MVANRQHQQAYELANQKMVQDAALQQAEFEEKRKEFAMSYSLKLRDLAETGDLNKARAEYYRNAGAAKLKGMQMLNDYNVELAKQQGEAMDDFNKAGLNDPGLQAKNPVVFAKNAQDWMDEWGNSPNAQIRRNIVELNGRIKPLNVTIPKAVDIEGSGPDQVVKGRGGNRSVSALEVIQKLQDPTTSDEMMNLLDAGGYMKHTPGTPGTDPNWWQRNFGGQKSTPPTESTSQIQDPVASWLKMGKGLDMSSRKSSKVPEMMAPSSAANKGVGDLRARIQSQLFDTQGDQQTQQDENAYPSAAPASLTPATTLQFGPTQQQQNQQQALSQARAALQAGAPFPAIAQRLQAMEIDPNLLLQTEPASSIFNDNSSAIA